MSYPNRRGGGQPGADGRPVELQQGSGYIQWRYQGETTWRNLMPSSMLTGADGKPVNLRVNSGWIQWQHQGDASWQNLMSTADMKGEPGPANTLSIGSVQQLPPGSSPQISISGDSPSQVISFAMPAPKDGIDGKDGTNGKDGSNGVNSALSVGTVTALPAGSNPTVQITGSAPSQTINFGIPLPVNGTNGTNGINGANNTITIGAVTALPAGSTPTASITGSSPNQVLSLGIPLPTNGTNGRDGKDGVNGANNTLSIGTVTTGTAAASITGNSPNQVLNLVLPAPVNGTNGTNGTNGVGIASQSIAYQQSSSGTTPPPGTWSSTVPSVARGNYLWTRIVITLTDGSSSTSYAVAYQAIDGTNGTNGINGTNGANYTPQTMVARTVNVATAYQHTDLTKPYKVILNARSTQTVTVAGIVNDRVELRVGPNAASVAPGGTGGFSVGIWESGITGIALMVGAAVQDGGQLTADVPAGWYFQVNRLSGGNATIVSCFTQSMS